MARPRLRRPAALSPERAARLCEFELRRGQPLPLFEALSHSDTALEDLAQGSRAAIEETTLAPRLREVLILRTLAQWRARAEWDVHALIYAPVAPLTVAEVEWLGGTERPTRWSPAERLLIDIADSLRREAGLAANLWGAVEHLFSPEQCAEILMIATQYVKVALMTNALAIPPLVPDGPSIAQSKRH